MIQFRKLKDTITGTINGRPFNMPRTEANVDYLEAAQKDPNISLESILAFIKSGLKQEVAQKCEYLTYAPATQEYFLVLNKVKSKNPLPAGLAERIEESFEKGEDYLPVIKAWIRLLANPRYTPGMGDYFMEYLNTTHTDWTEAKRLEEEEEYTSDAAQALATYPDLAITQEGLLATYKVAELVTWKWEMEKQEDGSFKKVLKDAYKTAPDKIDPVTGDLVEKGEMEKPEHLEDYVFTPAIHKSGDKFMSGDKLGYEYQVGKQQYLPKNAKRNLQNTFGGGGLYIGGLNYVESYRNDECKVLNCLVNPGDILSFQSAGQAIRTDALFPNSVWDETVPLKGQYHSSDYDKLSTERLEALMQEALKEEIDAAQKVLDKIDGLDVKLSE